jgi:hypothetical protein
MSPDSDDFRILSPTAILGYGFPEASFLRGMELHPDLVAVDAGSADPGPYYLGAGVSFTDRAAVKRDLRFMIRHARERDIPVVVGSCGGSGAAPHLHWTRSIVEEILEEDDIAARLGLISADIDPEQVIGAMQRGEINPAAGAGPLQAERVRESSHIVAQMGVEPIIEALRQGCDIVLAGRAYDPAVFAALPIMHGYDPGLAIHLGKILECAAIAADPGSGADSVMGILHRDSFELVPLSDDRRFTAASVAAHSLYEKSDPVRLPGPGGCLDLSEVTFREEEGGRVRVRGSRFLAAEDFLVKLEGARRVGFRTVSVAGVRDPIMIDTIEGILAAVKARVTASTTEEGVGGSLHFHVYGRNGVMGTREPTTNPASHELGIVIEGIAPTQKEADTICSLARSTLLHYGYPGRIATAGNLAFPFSPSDMKAGAVYEFSLYHLMAVNDQSLFPLEVVDR